MIRGMERNLLRALSSRHDLELVAENPDDPTDIPTGDAMNNCAVQPANTAPKVIPRGEVEDDQSKRTAHRSSPNDLAGLS